MVATRIMNTQRLENIVCGLFVVLMMAGCWKSETEVIDDANSINPWGDARYITIDEPNKKYADPAKLLTWNGTEFSVYGSEGSWRFAKQATGLLSFLDSERLIVSYPENGPDDRRYLYVELENDELRVFAIDPDKLGIEKREYGGYDAIEINSLAALRQSIDRVLDKDAFAHDATIVYVAETINSTQASQHRLLIEQYKRQVAEEKAAKEKEDRERSARIAADKARRDKVEAEARASAQRPRAGRPRKIDLLDIGDGVYVQGFVSDELAYIVRIDKYDNTVKVRRASDGTTRWVRVNDIITREESRANDFARTIAGGAILICLFSPESCQNN